MRTQRVDGGVAEHHGRRRHVEHVVHGVHRHVRDVDQHAEAVHLLHHVLKTCSSHFSHSIKVQACCAGQTYSRKQGRVTRTGFCVSCEE